MSLPRIAITLGDPAGIGPEIVAKALSSRTVYRLCRPLVVGDRRFLSGRLSLPKKFPVRFVDVPARAPEKIVPGRLSAEAGRAAYDAIRAAAALIEAKEADALVTAPVSKEAVTRAGIPFSGHTELLAELAGARDYCMLMIAGPLRSVMVTRHVPLAQVSRRLSPGVILSAVLQAEKFLRERAGIRAPRVAVCALNPHAGEGGLLGTEEKEIILPAVRAARKKGVAAEGPLPCDSAWLKMRDGKFDLLAAMYHDQTMTGLKCLAPEKIVNVTAGLPYVRTSPGHGTAFDIAGRGRADARPMLEAIKAAAAFSLIE